MLTRTNTVIVFFLAALLGSFAYASAATPLEALRAKFPRGIPWKVEVFGLDGKSEGKIEMRITTDAASSCLGGMDGGVRAEFTDKHALSPKLFVASYGVAKFAGNTIKIDLTGGICDAYLIMSGEIAPDGSSSGRVYRFGRQGADDVATYRAVAAE